MLHTSNEAVRVASAAVSNLKHDALTHDGCACSLLIASPAIHHFPTNRKTTEDYPCRITTLIALEDDDIADSYTEIVVSNVFPDILRDLRDELKRREWCSQASQLLCFLCVPSSRLRCKRTPNKAHLMQCRYCTMHDCRTPEARDDCSMHVWLRPSTLDMHIGGFLRFDASASPRSCCKSMLPAPALEHLLDDAILQCECSAAFPPARRCVRCITFSSTASPSSCGASCLKMCAATTGSALRAASRSTFLTTGNFEIQKPKLKCFGYRWL